VLVALTRLDTARQSRPRPGRRRAELIGNLPPLRCCSVGIILGERRGNEGGDDAPPAPACIRQRDAHEVDAAPLPAGVEHLADGGLDALC
jgi:hypothetical protein